jgi:uncharacterized membrane protein YqjE
MLRDSIAKFFKVDSFISNLTGYVETRIELLKVEAKEELSKGLSSVLLYLMMAFAFTLVVIFISIGIAWKISEHLGGLAGFGIVAGFYLVVGLILVFSRETLGKKIEKKIATALNKKKDK